MKISIIKSIKCDFFEELLEVQNKLFEEGYSWNSNAIYKTENKEDFIGGFPLLILMNSEGKVLYCRMVDLKNIDEYKDETYKYNYINFSVFMRKYKLKNIINDKV